MQLLSLQIRMANKFSMRKEVKEIVLALAMVARLFVVQLYYEHRHHRVIRWSTSSIVNNYHMHLASLLNLCYSLLFFIFSLANAGLMEMLHHFNAIFPPLSPLHSSLIYTYLRITYWFSSVSQIRWWLIVVTRFMIHCMYINFPFTVHSSQQPKGTKQ